MYLVEKVLRVRLYKQLKHMIQKLIDGKKLVHYQNHDEIMQRVQSMEKYGHVVVLAHYLKLNQQMN